MLPASQILTFLERLAPLALAESWDNVGLLLGDSSIEVSRIMTCLTVTPASVAEAVEEHANLIVSHHPILFRPTQKLTTATAEGRLLLPLLRAGIAVYSPHTAFDNCTNGINELLGAKLGLTNVKPLRPLPLNQVKIVVLVPLADLAKVSDALFTAGAGVIGQYSQCSFRLQGTGTFFGSDASNPTVGEKGRREEVQEYRLEVVCPAESLGEAIKRMRAAHSYEEPAFDVYPLQSGKGPTGVGRIGTLALEESLQRFAQRVKSALSARTLQMVGTANRPVRSVALACGAAGELLKDAIQAKADVFLTGELRFHDLLTAEAAGLGLVLPGHYATERLGVEQLADLLQRGFSGCQVWASRRETEPLWGSAP